MSSKITPELIEQLVAGIGAGLWDAQNALRAGIHPRTLADWLARGLREEAEEPYATLARRYLQASAEIEVAVIQYVFAGAQTAKVRRKTVTESGPPRCAEFTGGTAGKEHPEGSTLQRVTEQLRGDWRAATWYLEHRWPMRWGNRADERHELPLAKILESAESRPADLAELLANPTPELQAAMFQAREQILALLAPEVLALPEPSR